MSKNKQYLTVLKNIPKCPECHSKNIEQIEPDINILYCKNCGLILNEPNYYIDRTIVKSNIMKQYGETLQWDGLNNKWEPITKQ